ncbi:unnamed protein product [Adineta steineri]|uniref:RanBP2-type domain-containing protein n=1 Tax=Adineta steineri TaxID=433720 RepID=A0A814L7B5_9BILA|nr:unnamed protein product [Adineta steineri]CAF1277023.1 unnamed protein product [Adineta steineri]CAF1277424.1 unnamed protein product [Adineta steineri]CAF1561205.1 unnamed protein product [Adineta steineri]
MSVLAYSSGRIHFVPNDKQTLERNYNDRSCIQILQDEDMTNYSLRAIDVENSNAKIFDCIIKDSNQYRFGESSDVPDEINDSNGTYRLWLSGDSRKAFHETLRTVVEMLFPKSSPNTNFTTANNTYTNKDSVKIDKPNKTVNLTSDARDTLVDIHNLSRSIKQGNQDEAAQLTTQLTSQGIRIQDKLLKPLQNEEEFQILVQFDGNEYGVDQNGGTIPVKVFPSTTVRELRAAFELAYNYCPTNQYFFVNGQLVNDNSTMTELTVGPNSLFVLFLLTHPKIFKNNGPWNCSTCSTQNQENDIRCSICLALRVE